MIAAGVAGSSRSAPPGASASPRSSKQLETEHRRSHDHCSCARSPVMDPYANIVNTRPGRIIARRVGLPLPERLERYTPGGPVIDGPVLLGAAPGATLVKPIAGILAAIRAETAVTV